MRSTALALGRRHLLEDFGLLLRGQVFEDVGRVVGIEIADALGDGLGGHLFEDFLADRVVDLGQRGEVELAAHQLDKARPQLGIERLDQVAGVGLVQLADQRLQGRGVAAFDRLAARGREIRSGSRRRRRGRRQAARPRSCQPDRPCRPRRRESVEEESARLYAAHSIAGNRAAATRSSPVLPPPLSSAHGWTSRAARCDLSCSLSLLALTASPGAAADCPGNPAALGTARVLAIDPAQTAPVGRKQFPQTLPLEPKEVVLTFDDGPSPGATDRVLAALKHECVHATFFMLGRNAAAHPATGQARPRRGPYRRASQLPASAAQPHEPGTRRGRDRSRHRGGGGRSLWRARRPAADAVLPLPGLCSAARRCWSGSRQRGIAVFGADLWPGDWNPMTPKHERDAAAQAVNERRAAASCCCTTPSRRPRRCCPSCCASSSAAAIAIVHIVPGAVKDAR